MHYLCRRRHEHPIFIGEMRASIKSDSAQRVCVNRGPASISRLDVIGWAERQKSAHLNLCSHTRAYLSNLKPITPVRMHPQRCPLFTAQTKAFSPLDRDFCCAASQTSDATTINHRGRPLRSILLVTKRVCRSLIAKATHSVRYLFLKIKF